MKKNRAAGLALGLVMVLGPVALMAATMAASQPMNVFVSIAPQAYAARAVGGNHVNVYVLVPPGSSHETYEPTPRQMLELGRARIFFRIGLPFEEAWIGSLRENEKNLMIVDTRQGIKLIAASTADTDEPAPAPGQRGQDPHIWLDPNLAKIQGRTMRDALIRAAPEDMHDFEKNYLTFAQTMDDLDREIRSIVSRATQKRFMVYHPAWGYFARAYGLDQIAIEMEGKDPGPQSLARVIALAKAQKIKTIFVQPQYSTKSAEVIARAIGGVVVPMDPTPTDYPQALLALARAIAGEKI